MQNIRKRLFTLLELLVVLMILSFGLVLTGIKINSIYQEQRFLSETQQVLNHLNMAQDLMLITDADVFMKLKTDSEKNCLTIWLEIEKPLEEAWAKFIERKIHLNAIQSYQFDNEHHSLLTLRFSLGKMSQGTLNLYESKSDDSNAKEKRKATIELAGYPKNFVFQTSVNSISTKRQKSQLLYPSEVYEKLYINPKQDDDENS